MKFAKLTFDQMTDVHEKFLEEQKKKASAWFKSGNAGMKSVTEDYAKFMGNAKKYDLDDVPNYFRDLWAIDPTSMTKITNQIWSRRCRSR